MEPCKDTFTAHRWVLVPNVNEASVFECIVCDEVIDAEYLAREYEKLRIQRARRHSNYTNQGE